MVTENLKIVEEKIVQACARSGRRRSDVTLIAVSKTKPAEMMTGDDGETGNIKRA